MTTDTERLDWLVSMEGNSNLMYLVSDDGGKWAVSTSGFQQVPEEDGFKEPVTIGCIVEPHQWKDSIREAIDEAMKGDV